MNLEDFIRSSGYFFDFLQMVAPLVVLLWVTDRILEGGK
jgi:hypothetical protein